MISELIRSLALSKFTQPNVDFLGKVTRRFRVYPQHIDFNMHINNAKYLTFFERGRWDHSVQTGTFNQLLSNGLNFIVAGIDVTYIRELKLFQAFDIETEYVGWDEKYFYLEQRCLVNGKLHSHALIKAVYLQKGKVAAPIHVCKTLGIDVEENHMPEHMELWKDLATAKRAFSEK